MNNIFASYTLDKKEISTLRKIVENALDNYPITLSAQNNRFEMIRVLQENCENPKFKSAINNFVTEESTEMDIIDKLSSAFKKYYIDAYTDDDMPWINLKIMLRMNGTVYRLARILLPITKDKRYEIQPAKLFGDVSEAVIVAG